MSAKPPFCVCIFLVLLSSTLAQFHDRFQAYEEQCLEESFQCWDKECISKELYCNGNIDCRDGSDEMFCPGRDLTAADCRSFGLLRCARDAACVARTALCDGVEDCDDGSDEEGCVDALPPPANSSCRGFACADGACISPLWVCDGRSDCAGGDDERDDTLCRVTKYYDAAACSPLDPATWSRRHYRCADASHCLPEARMCDGVADCRDNSDEGDFCRDWSTMCANHTCPGGASCRRGPGGAACDCPRRPEPYPPGACTSACARGRPACAQLCRERADGGYQCACAEGYRGDGETCLANGPEPLLFISTKTDIKYYSLRSKQIAVVVPAVQDAREVTFDGEYVYWVDRSSGHEAIVRAKLHDSSNVETLVSLGLSAPGRPVAAAGLLYWTDAERGLLAACAPGPAPARAACAVLPAAARAPAHLAVDVARGELYYADSFGDTAVIMRAGLDGAGARAFVRGLPEYPTSVAVDPPAGRIYFVVRDQVNVARMDGQGEYELFSESQFPPSSLAVFESSVFTAEALTRRVRATRKGGAGGAGGAGARRHATLLNLQEYISGISVYHPSLQPPTACADHTCEGLSVPRAAGCTCLCAEGRALVDGDTCEDLPSSSENSLLVAAGAFALQLRYERLEHPSLEPWKLRVGRIDALAYDPVEGVVYIYDGQRATLSAAQVGELATGEPRALTQAFEGVVDMAYDYVSEVLYLVDAASRALEVYSPRLDSRAVLMRFSEHETPVSVCVLPDYGRIFVAVFDRAQDLVYVDVASADGHHRRRAVSSGLVGPHVQLRYSQERNAVFVTDGSSGTIKTIDPDGAPGELYALTSTTLSGLAAAARRVFWTERRAPRLFWSDTNETVKNVRRMELEHFPAGAQLHLAALPPAPAARDPLLQHPCRARPCDHFCLQVEHLSPNRVPDAVPLPYQCACPLGLVLAEGACVRLRACDGLYCRQGDACVDGARCDGREDCPSGEDEVGCDLTPDERSALFRPPLSCPEGEKLCADACVDEDVRCSNETAACDSEQFACPSGACVSRSRLCDGVPDCAGAEDEQAAACAQFECYEFEFTCAVGSCVAAHWRCDGDADCADGSDEFDCPDAESSEPCGLGEFACGDGACVAAALRCDARRDCRDYSDEEGCDDEPAFGELDDMDVTAECGSNEYTCALNRSLCLPLAARCDGRADCPGASDEAGCAACAAGLFRCERESRCVPAARVCDGAPDCRDASDEAARNCEAKKAQWQPLSSTACSGFHCASGECVAWAEACDGVAVCRDGSDEGPLCDNKTMCAGACEQQCHASPRGPACACRGGWAARGARCVDVDECEAWSGAWGGAGGGACAQLCVNTPGSYECRCRPGYALEPDLRSCKPLAGEARALLVRAGGLYEEPLRGARPRLFRTLSGLQVDAFDYDIKNDIVYAASRASGVVRAAAGAGAPWPQVVDIRNVGMPAAVVADWATRAVFIYDDSPGGRCVRACRVAERKCAVVVRLESQSELTAMTIDPYHRRLVYCERSPRGSRVWWQALSGPPALPLARAAACSGLAYDHDRALIYVAEAEPPGVKAISYAGSIKQVITNKTLLQAPKGLSIMDNQLYFMKPESMTLGHCKVDHDRCNTVRNIKLDNVGSFMLNNPMVQDASLPDACAAAACGPALCVPGAASAAGADCVCADGHRARDCRGHDDPRAPVFVGVGAPQWARQLGAALAAAAAAGLCAGCCYRYARKAPSDGAPAADLSVSFNSSRGELRDDVATISGFAQRVRRLAARPGGGEALKPGGSLDPEKPGELPPAGGEARKELLELGSHVSEVTEAGAPRGLWGLRELRLRVLRALPFFGRPKVNETAYRNPLFDILSETFGSTRPTMERGKWIHTDGRLV